MRRWVWAVALVAAACSSTDGASSIGESAVTLQASSQSAEPPLKDSGGDGSLTSASSLATAQTTAATAIAGSSCAAYEPVVRGTLPSEFSELSGWALSQRHPDVLWGHNDAGEGARLIAISTVDGSLVGDVSLTGATSADWEDVATSTDASGQHWLVIADVGDNREARTEVNLVLVPEPDLSPTPKTVPAEGLVTVIWAGGAHDVEALIVDPWTGDAVVVGKRFGDAREVSVDRIPAASLVPGATVTSERVGTFRVPEGERFGPTGGSVSADGSTIGLVFYAQTMVWNRAPGMSVADAITGEVPCIVGSGSGQYESLAIEADGSLLIATEGRSVPFTALVPIESTTP